MNEIACAIDGKDTISHATSRVSAVLKSIFASNVAIGSGDEQMATVTRGVRKQAW